MWLSGLQFRLAGGNQVVDRNGAGRNSMIVSYGAGFVIVLFYGV